MKFTISWWDKKEGVGIATSESGTECLLHQSNFSSQQCNSFEPNMVIHGEPKEISTGIFIVEKARIASKSNVKTTTPKKSLREIAA